MTVHKEPSLEGPSVFWISPSEFWSLELDFYLVYCFGCSTKYSKNHQTRSGLWDLIEHILLCDPNIILLYRIYVICYYNDLTLVNRGFIRLDLDQREPFFCQIDLKSHAFGYQAGKVRANLTHKGLLIGGWWIDHLEQYYVELIWDDQGG